MSKDDLISDRYRVSDPSARRFWNGVAVAACDGYEVIGLARRDGWDAVASWGRDGWDLGSWPLVIIFTRDCGDRHQLAYYVEHDAAIYEYETVAECNDAIDSLAFFHWSSNGESWTAGVDTVEGMPARLCGPFKTARSTQAS